MISTTDSTTAAIRPETGTALSNISWIVVIALLPFTLRIKERDRRTSFMVLTLILGLLISPLAGCGGGTATTVPPPPVVLNTPAGSYTVNFVVSGAAASNSTPLTLQVQ